MYLKLSYYIAFVSILLILEHLLIIDVEKKEMDCENLKHLETLIGQTIYRKFTYICIKP